MILLFVFILFLSFALFPFLFNNIKKKKKIMGPCFCDSSNLVVGVPYFNALGTMLVSVGGGVGVHWLNVTMRSLYVQWVIFFKIFFFGVFCFTCTVHTRLISYTLHTILSHVHLNKHTQRALYSSVNCFSLHSTYSTSHQNHRLIAKISPILLVIVSNCASF